MTEIVDAQNKATPAEVAEVFFNVVSSPRKLLNLLGKAELKRYLESCCKEEGVADSTSVRDVREVILAVWDNPDADAATWQVCIHDVDFIGL